MKLSAKISLTVVLIVALAMGFAGYAVVSSVYRVQLEHQVRAAVEETQLMCSVLGSMALERRSAGTPESTRATMEELLKTAPFQSYRLALNWEQTGDEAVRYRIVSVPDGKSAVYDIVIICRFTVDQTPYFLQGRYDVTEVYTLREQYLHTFQMVYLAAVVVSLVLGFSTGAVLTAPVRKLSRTAKQIAGGNYGVRAKVRTSDEIGVLAQQFNGMAQELERHIASLEEATQKQRDFTASFAHELKTPLTSIIGYADTLRSRRLPENQQFEAASFIFTEGRRLETMSHSLLRLFSLDTEQPQLVPNSALSIAREVEESIAYPLKQRQLVLDVRVEDKRILCERSLLTILLYNLLDNARKASEPGSKLTLLGGSVAGGFCFAVKDRGRGIPPEALSRIMEPFYMVDKSRSRAEGGAGLGLALGQRIAQVHGTSLRYESKVGRGTVVSFILKEAGK